MTIFDIIQPMKQYNCVVCVKQVPDTKKVTGDAMKADGTINRAALPAIFNPEDKCALEAALRVKETYGVSEPYNEPRPDPAAHESGSGRALAPAAA